MATVPNAMCYEQLMMRTYFDWAFTLPKWWFVLMIIVIPVSIALFVGGVVAMALLPTSWAPVIDRWWPAIYAGTIFQTTVFMLRKP